MEREGGGGMATTQQRCGAKSELRRMKRKLSSSCSKKLRPPAALHLFNPSPLLTTAFLLLFHNFSPHMSSPLLPSAFALPMRTPEVPLKASQQLLLLPYMQVPQQFAAQLLPNHLTEADFELAAATEGLLDGGWATTDGMNNSNNNTTFLTAEDFRNAEKYSHLLFGDNKSSTSTAAVDNLEAGAVKISKQNFREGNGGGGGGGGGGGNPRLGDIRGKAALRREHVFPAGYSLRSKSSLLGHSRNGMEFVRRRHHNGVSSVVKKWPGGRIPYVLSQQYTARERAILARAFNEYHQRTCVRFVPRRPAPMADRDFLFIAKIDGCYSDVGRAGGRQELSLDNGCLHLDTVLHELMHSVGFYHEHERWDRDNFISILWPNIDKEAFDQFGRVDLSESSYYDQPYDYLSIMHYDSMAFSRNGLETMVARQPTMTPLLGSATDFSAIDLAKIRRMYQCPPTASAPTVTFLSPPPQFQQQPPPPPAPALPRPPAPPPPPQLEGARPPMPPPHIISNLLPMPVVAAAQPGGNSPPSPPSPPPVQTVGGVDGMGREILVAHQQLLPPPPLLPPSPSPIEMEEVAAGLFSAQPPPVSTLPQRIIAESGVERGIGSGGGGGGGPSVMGVTHRLAHAYPVWVQPPPPLPPPLPPPHLVRTGIAVASPFVVDGGGGQWTRAWGRWWRRWRLKKRRRKIRDQNSRSGGNSSMDGS